MEWLARSDAMVEHLPNVMNVFRSNPHWVGQRLVERPYSCQTHQSRGSRTLLGGCRVRVCYWPINVLSKSPMLVPTRVLSIAYRPNANSLHALWPIRTPRATCAKCKFYDTPAGHKAIPSQIHIFPSSGNDKRV